MTIPKTEQVRNFLASGDTKSALRIAKGFRMLDGADRTSIGKAWSALTNPTFYRDIQQDPDTLVQAGICTLQRLYLTNQ